ncbi:MAG: TetR/AcrR family transcriptional regulator [Syntrophomonas sp.]|nr:TetR/AcrR family transcriptional regulator [Syntrophomonas sp.]
MKFNDKQSEERVLEKAADLLVRRGVRGCNMEQLAAESGLAKNTLYRIIGSKEQLIESVVLSRYRFMKTKMVEIINQEGDYLQTLETMADEFAVYINTFYGDFFHEVFREYPGIEKTVRRQQDEMTTRIIEYLRRGITEGYLRKDLEPESMFKYLQAIILFFVDSELKGSEQSLKIREGFGCLLYGAAVRTSQSCSEYGGRGSEM